MAGNSSVPGIEFTPTGLRIPADSEILAGIQADMNAAFGGNLNPSLSTPQGQLATSQSAVLSARNAEFAKFVNQIDPDTADGFMQDAIARVYFINRRPAVPTTVQVVCNGLGGVVIPVGALVRDSSGIVYSCSQGGVISATGNITLPFVSTTPGPTPCPIGAISGAPYRAILGWDRATNIVAGIPGSLVETRAEFEYRRRQSVAINGRGTLPSIYANVFDVEGVVDVYATENTSDEPITVGETGYVMLPHSIYIAVVGGNPQDVAKAIWLRKDAGADYNGNTSVTVQDESGYNYPYPTYQVKFQTPAAKSIKFAVRIAKNPSLPNDIVSRVNSEIIKAFTGGDGGQRARIGSTIFASRFYSAVSQISPVVSILSILIGTVSADSPAVTLGVDEAPAVSSGDIDVILV